MRSTLRAVTDHYRQPRILGLDLLRIIASMTVIVHHGNVVGGFGRNLFSAVVAADGQFAVDIFFVLSGWLLTRQVLRMRSAFPSPIRFATRFWTRRWMRTLPPYWFLLVIIVLFGLGPTAHMTPAAVSSLLLLHAAFLQTIFVPDVHYLVFVAWSLVTEEWFYLLLPLAIVLAIWLRRGWVRAILAAVVLLTPMAVRAVLLMMPIESWRVLTMPQARFDGLVIGALLAAASFRSAWWDWALAYRRTLFGLGMLSLAVTIGLGLFGGRVYNVFSILAFSAAIGLTMPLMSQLRWPAGAPAFAVMASAYLSELTYPLYLLHPMIDLHWTHQVGLARLFYAMAGALLLLLGASALHLGIERPFLALRDRREARKLATWKEPAQPPAPPEPAGARLVRPSPPVTAA